MDFDACVIGSGMSGLTAASLLAKHGLKVGVLEQNWIPGGCTSSYWRKGFVNEQLLITAQNYLTEVNVLFGATALCYTNYGN